MSESRRDIEVADHSIAAEFGRVAVIRGDACVLPLPDASVDLIVTSPPYWALRSYTDGGEHYAGQVGAEPTPGEYVDALIDCTREWIRVLKPTGSIFVNLGDKYASSGGHGPSATSARADRASHRAWAGRAQQNSSATPNKGLLYLPERYRIAATDQLGLIGRAVIVWSKPNGLPESVRDRVRRSHEDWVHLVKQPRYYAAVDEIREPQRSRGERHEGRSGYVNATGRPGGDGIPRSFTTRALNPLGALPGSVWAIPTQPLTIPPEMDVQHFAAFPLEWPRRLIAGWSPPSICTACGEGRWPVTERPGLLGGNNNPDLASRRRSTIIGGSREWAHRTANPDRITGYVCACPEPTASTRPALIVDPFGGTGTTALAAKVVGRDAVTVDRSADYCRLARWRTADRGELARALRVPKPVPVAEEQGELFADLESGLA